MRARFRGIAFATYPPNEAIYVSPSQVFLKGGTEYEVHAVSVYNRVTFLLVIDDLQTPVFLPRVLFAVVDPRVPDDWLCNVFPEGPVQLVIGPAFVAKDLAAYNGMVDQERLQVEALWERVDRAARAATEESDDE